MNNTITAVVFPGQGAQRQGMGKDFFDNVAVSRDTYEQASQALGWNVASLCFEGSTHLDMTEFAQPCILTTEIAMLRGLESLYDFRPHFFGGHSLGEYTALVAAGAMPFTQAVQAVQARGRLMQAAAPAGTGAMAAVISDDMDVAHLIRIIEELKLDAANINSPNQVVISGDASTMDLAETRLTKALGRDTGMRFVALNVSAPFHSRYMRPVEAKFKRVLKKISTTLVPENAPKVTANFTGGFHSSKRETIINTLVSQLSNPVRWTDNMAALAQKTRKIYEIGPNRPLRGFFKGMGITCQAITTLAAAQRVFE